MGEVRDKRERFGLLASDRESATVPQHTQSAGEELIKQLLKKQTNSRTSLDEQLRVRQNFVPASGSGESSHVSSFVINSDVSIEDLQKKTGLSRQQLESSLSEKPNSAVAKLYRFALSNQTSVNAQHDLISQLPDHPLNRLKALEEELMREIGKDKIVDKKKQKRRKRRRKILVGSMVTRDDGLSNKVPEISECSSSLSAEFQHDEGDKADTTTQDSSDDESTVRRKRPSLWDVKNVETMEKHVVTCREPKLFTIKDGKIVEVTEELGET